MFICLQTLLKSGTLHGSSFILSPHLTLPVSRGKIYPRFSEKRFLHCKLTFGLTSFPHSVSRQALYNTRRLVGTRTGRPLIVPVTPTSPPPLPYSLSFPRSPVWYLRLPGIDPEAYEKICTIPRKLPKLIPSVYWTESRVYLVRSRS